MTGRGAAHEYAGLMIDETLLEAIDKMDKAVGHVQSQFQTVRTGRAAPALIEKLQVEYYGSPVPLQQLAGIQVPEARQLLVRPHDRSTLGAIEKTIRDSDLGVNPSNDGTVIRLSFPPLTEERRKQLVKLVHGHVEEGKVAVRNVRRDAMTNVKELLNEKLIGEDDERRAEHQVDELAKRFVGEADKVGKTKEQEVLEF